MPEVNPHKHENKVVATTLTGAPVKWCRLCGRVAVGPTAGVKEVLVYEVGNLNPVWWSDA